MECAQVKMNIQVFIPGVCSFTLGEAPSGKVRWHIIIIKIIFVKIVFIKIIAIQIILREDTTIDLDGPGPLPPFSVTCYRSSKGFVTAVRFNIDQCCNLHPWQHPHIFKFLFRIMPCQSYPVEGMTTKR